MMVRPACVWLVVVVLFSVGLLAADPTLTSAWRIREVAIDGANAEWAGLTSLEKAPAVAVVNDDEFAYVIVSTSDQQLRRQLGAGLIVWFDSKHKKEKTFGVQIAGAVVRPLPGAADAASDSDLIRPPSSGPSFQPRIDQFDLLGPGRNERHLIRLHDGLGVALGATTTEGVLAYELKLPLVRTDTRTYAIGALPGATISLGLETPELPRNFAPRGGGGAGGRAPRGQFGAPGMGGVGQGGGRGGGFGGGQRPRDEDIKPLSIWMSLKLAVPN